MRTSETIREQLTNLATDLRYRAIILAREADTIGGIDKEKLGKAAGLRFAANEIQAILDAQPGDQG